MTENEKAVQDLTESEVQYGMEMCMELLDCSNINASKSNLAFLMSELSDKYGGAGLGAVFTAYANRNF